MHRHGLGVDELPALAGRCSAASGSRGWRSTCRWTGTAAIEPAAEVADWLQRLDGCRRTDRHGVGQPPHGPRAGPACAATSRRRRSGRGSGPRCGWATAVRSPPAARCWTCTRSSAARTTATGGGARRGTATWSWSAAAPRTAWPSRRRGRCAGRSGGARRWPSARWRRRTSRCRRSGGPASSGGSPSRRTCTCRCCCCRPPSTPPAIGTELDCDVRLTTLHPDAVAPLPPAPTPPPTPTRRR